MINKLHKIVHSDLEKMIANEQEVHFRDYYDPKFLAELLSRMKFTDREVEELTTFYTELFYKPVLDTYRNIVKPIGYKNNPRGE